MQAGVAVHLARKRDDPVPDALVAIQQASTDAMRELRSTLEVLRADGVDPGETGDSTASGNGAGSGLDRLEALVEGTRRAGLPVVVSIGGRRRDLPAP